MSMIAVEILQFREPTLILQATVEALIKTLNCRSDQKSIQREIAKWKGEELEEAVQTNGGAIGLVRTYEEWVKHPVGSALAKQPIVQIIKIGESAPIPLPKKGDQPLSDIRVLDNSHVVGGPVCARILAEFGADVLHIAQPNYPEASFVQMEVNNGKKSANLDLRSKKGNCKRFLV